MAQTAGAASRARAWFLDLDDTLHDASAAILPTIDARMTDYVVRELRLDRAAADRLRHGYWQRYGATLLGLIRHHAVDPHHFLHHAHDFDVATLVAGERGLAGLLRGLPGRKILLTNAPARYAQAVITALRIDRHLGRRYAIERMRVHGQWRPKPSRAMLRVVRARERVGAATAVLVDDNLANLRAARAVGFATVWMAGGRRPGARPAYVDLRVRSLRDLARRRSALPRGGTS